MRAREAWLHTERLVSSQVISLSGAAIDAAFSKTEVARALVKETGGCSGQLIFRDLPLENYYKDQLHFFLRFLILLLRPLHRNVMQLCEAGYDGVGMLAAGLRTIGLGNKAAQMERNLAAATAAKGHRDDAGGSNNTSPSEPALATSFKGILDELERRKLIVGTSTTPGTLKTQLSSRGLPLRGCKAELLHHLAHALVAERRTQAAGGAAPSFATDIEQRDAELKRTVFRYKSVTFDKQELTEIMHKNIDYCASQ